MPIMMIELTEEEYEWIKRICKRQNESPESLAKRALLVMANSMDPKLRQIRKDG